MHYRAFSRPSRFRSIYARILMLLLATALVPQVASATETYDPLIIAKKQLSKPIDLIVKDDARSREIPIRVYLPEETSAAPVVLFSHGLGGSRENNPYLGNHWAARGYVAVFITHPGSDDSVWRGKPFAQRLLAMKQAANLENFLLRVKDVPAVIDQLERWNKADGNELEGRMDLEHIGMCGHSFGAVTTQAVSGQRYSTRMRRSPTNESKPPSRSAPARHAKVTRSRRSAT